MPSKNNNNIYDLASSKMTKEEQLNNEFKEFLFDNHNDFNSFELDQITESYSDIDFELTSFSKGSNELTLKVDGLAPQTFALDKIDGNHNAVLERLKQDCIKHSRVYDIADAPANSPPPLPTTPKPITTLDLLESNYRQNMNLSTLNTKQKVFCIKMNQLVSTMSVDQVKGILSQISNGGDEVRYQDKIKKALTGHSHNKPPLPAKVHGKALSEVNKVRNSHNNPVYDQDSPALTEKEAFEAITKSYVEFKQRNDSTYNLSKSKVGIRARKDLSSKYKDITRTDLMTILKKTTADLKDNGQINYLPTVAKLLKERGEILRPPKVDRTTKPNLKR